MLKSDLFTNSGTSCCGDQFLLIKARLFIWNIYIYAYEKAGTNPLHFSANIWYGQYIYSICGERYRAWHATTFPGWGLTRLAHQESSRKCLLCINNNNRKCSSDTAAEKKSGNSESYLRWKWEKEHGNKTPNHRDLVSKVLTAEYSFFCASSHKFQLHVGRCVVIPLPT